MDLGVRLRVRLWPGGGPGFVLLHGLASNARTWDLVARDLAGAGHAVAAPDQRGHGQSEKPAAGYDFAAVTSDLAGLADRLGWSRPVVVGQSWGGNVALEFGARHPGRARGLGFVDGGFIDLQSRPGATWERVARELRPPDLTGTRWEKLRALIRARNPEWSDAAVDAAMANFERLPDGTVRPWLTLERHMAILRSLWEQRPRDLYPRVREPVLLCAADQGGGDPEVRRSQAGAARKGLRRVSLRWFRQTSHDIHAHRPEALARVLLEELEDGVWRS